MASATKSSEILSISSSQIANLQPYLPPQDASSLHKPFVTLTYATSLDASLSLGPGIRTALSGQESKAMTHYLRGCHDAILVGLGTVQADDPSLGCQFVDVSESSGAGCGVQTGANGQGGSRPKRAMRHPRPVVVDKHAEWDLINAGGKLMRQAEVDGDRAPWVITAYEIKRGPFLRRKEVLERAGGQYICILPRRDETADTRSTDDENLQSGARPEHVRFDWHDILIALKAKGIKSVMIEGGGKIINSILECERPEEVIDSVILTIAPVWLGQGGVVASPARRNVGVEAGRLRDVSWSQMGQDMVLCGRLQTGIKDQVDN